MKEEEHKELTQQIYDSLYQTACSEEFHQSIDHNLLNEYFFDPLVVDKSVLPFKEKVISLNSTLINLPTTINSQTLNDLETVLSTNLTNLITEEKRVLYSAAFQKLQSTLSERIHDISINTYGSYACGFLLDGISDIDVEFSIPSDLGFGSQFKRVFDFMGLITKVLIKEGYEDVVFLRRARTPVIKFMCPETKINIDITFYKLSNPKKTELLKRYCPEDSIERLCVLFVRKWARRRDLIGTNKCMMNPYGWTLLMITFILAYKKQYENKIGGDKITLSKIVCEFLNFLVEFDSNTYTCSINSEGFILKKNDQFYEKQNTLLCIEDPFDSRDNAARNVTTLQLAYIRQQAKKTLDIITTGEDIDNIFILEKE